MFSFFFYPAYFFYLLYKEFPIYREYPLLARVDFYYLYHYFFFYPFLKNVYEKRKTGLSSGDLVYGETPYSSFQKALYFVPLNFESVFYDLGCGKGRLLFYVLEAYGIQCKGIEIMPTYCRIAKQTALRNGRGNEIDIIEGDYMKMDISDATVVYLSWTCYSDNRKKEVCKKLETLQNDTYVITSTTPIDHPDFEKVTVMNVPFSWGKGTLYVQRKITYAQTPSY